jgi:uncharacterized metal-binding protein YceD (DUF177 family)
MTPAHSQSPEFSYPVEVSTLPADGRTFQLSASAEECADVAKRLGLFKLEMLAASLHLSRASGGFITVSGYLDAEVVQACVVTLAPVPSQLREPLEMTFMEDPSAPPGKKRGGGEDLISVDEDDPPELVDEGRIDLGELAVEQLVLALNPYPRASGVSFGAKTWGEEGAGVPTKEDNPFAALEKLMKIKPH